VWVLALLGMAAGALPLPAIPTALLRRVRGAVAHEVSARRGLALTAEARAWISEPSKNVRRGAFVATAAFIARRALRRLGALGVLPPIFAWLEVYSLGVLFERYLTCHRQSPALRIDLDEARSVRAAIDEAMARVAALDLESARSGHQAAIEDLRDWSTRLSDTVLIGLASGPIYLRRRLETAFDHAIRTSSDAPEKMRESVNV
jgi:hypothetical protein